MQKATPVKMSLFYQNVSIAILHVAYLYGLLWLALPFIL